MNEYRYCFNTEVDPELNRKASELIKDILGAHVPASVLRRDPVNYPWLEVGVGYVAARTFPRGVVCDTLEEFEAGLRKLIS